MLRIPSFGVGLLACASLGLAFVPAACGADGERLVLQSGGREREALIWRPADAFQPRRLLLMLHGAGGSPERVRHFSARSLEKLAVEGGWLVVYPLGIEGTWNDCRRSPDYPARRADVADVDYLAELIATLSARHDIPPGEVIVAGFSNGAHMAFRLALERPDLVDTLVMAAALLPGEGESGCSGPVPALNVLHFAGTLDPLVPFGGGPSAGPAGDALGPVRSAEETIMAFVAAAGGARLAQFELPEADGNPATSATLREWRPAGRLIRQYVLHGAGHIVPQREVPLPAVVGPSAGDVDFGEALLDFLAQRPGRRSLAQSR